MIFLTVNIEPITACFIELFPFTENDSHTGRKPIEIKHLIELSNSGNILHLGEHTFPICVFASTYLTGFYVHFIADAYLLQQYF